MSGISSAYIRLFMLHGSETCPVKESNVIRLIIQRYYIVRAEDRNFTVELRKRLQFSTTRNVYRIKDYYGLVKRLKGSFRPSKYLAVDLEK